MIEIKQTVSKRSHCISSPWRLNMKNGKPEIIHFPLETGEDENSYLTRYPNIIREALAFNDEIKFLPSNNVLSSTYIHHGSYEGGFVIHDVAGWQKIVHDPENLKDTELMKKARYILHRHQAVNSYQYKLDNGSIQMQFKDYLKLYLSKVETNLNDTFSPDNVYPGGVVINDLVQFNRILKLPENRCNIEFLNGAFEIRLRNDALVEFKKRSLPRDQWPAFLEQCIKEQKIPMKVETTVPIKLNVVNQLKDCIQEDPKYPRSQVIANRELFKQILKDNWEDVPIQTEGLKYQLSELLLESYKYYESKKRFQYPFFRLTAELPTEDLTWEKYKDYAKMNKLNDTPDVTFIRENLILNADLIFPPEDDDVYEEDQVEQQKPDDPSESESEEEYYDDDD